MNGWSNKNAEKSEGNHLKYNYLEKTLLKLHKKLCQRTNKVRGADLTCGCWSGKIAPAQRTLQRLKFIWMK